MKDQYFGDINDYRKYGLLRIIIRASQLPVIVAWMLTPDDGSTDGKFTAYLDHSDRWSRYDPELFQALTRMKLSESKRQVSSIEVSDVLPQVRYFRLQVPDGPLERTNWLEELIQKAKGG